MLSGMKPIVLASTSRYRFELLSRLKLPFSVASPNVDETPQEGESARDCALRLASAKAQAVAQFHRGAIVIGSDQVAHSQGILLGKPGNRDAAIDQLLHMQGHATVFHTALAVLDTDHQALHTDCVDTTVRLRPLDSDTIKAYVDLEKPFDVAGAAKIESLGIALVESVSSTDPTALIGLPLIRLVSMLASIGIKVPGTAAAPSPHRQASTK